MKILAALIKHTNPLGPPHNPPIALVFRLQQTLFLPLAMLLPFSLLPQLMNSMLLLAQGAYPSLLSLAFLLEPELFLALHLLPQRKETAASGGQGRGGRR